MNQATTLIQSLPEEYKINRALYLTDQHTILFYCSTTYMLLLGEVRQALLSYQEDFIWILMMVLASTVFMESKTQL